MNKYGFALMVIAGVIGAAINRSQVVGSWIIVWAVVISAVAFGFAAAVDYFFFGSKKKTAAPDITVCPGCGNAVFKDEI